MRSADFVETANTSPAITLRSSLPEQQNLTKASRGESARAIGSSQSRARRQLLGRVSEPANIAERTTLPSTIWMPHSSFWVPRQRPARSSSPAAILDVQGWHPIER
jgi:hypothetical protein